MASFYRNKYVSDIPLKRPQETFVDDPGSLDEVCLDDLVFDVANDIKNVNNLHGFHALAIYRAVLEDLIFLTTNKDALMKFRRQQLQMYSLDLDTLSREVDGQERAGQNLQMGSKSPEPSPMLHLASPGSTGLLNAGASAGKCGSATSLGEVPGSELPPAQTQKQPPRSPFMAQADYSDISLVTTPAETESESGETKRSSETKGGFISTESLVKTTSLEIPSDPITRHNIERLKNEVLSHMSPEIKRQEDHLLRCFSLSKAPPITIEQFLVRIKTYSPSISVSVYIHSAYMIYKLCVLLGVVELTHLNVYRFVLASLRCSTKKLEDVHQKQKSFATVGGVSLRELCKIEVSFLYLFNFKMVVSECILNQFLATEFIPLRAYCASLRENQGS